MTHAGVSSFLLRARWQCVHMRPPAKLAGATSPRSPAGGGRGRHASLPIDARSCLLVVHGVKTEPRSVPWVRARLACRQVECPGVGGTGSRVEQGGGGQQQPAGRRFLPALQPRAACEQSPRRARCRAAHPRPTTGRAGLRAAGPGVCRFAAPGLATPTWLGSLRPPRLVG